MPLGANIRVRRSCGLPTVVVEQAANSFSPPDICIRILRWRQWRDQLLVQALVISLFVVVLDELVYAEAKMPLPTRHYTTQALFFDRTHQALRDSIQVRTSPWQFDWCYLTAI